MRLAGKTAIVTGGASGFGEGIAEVFSEQGANIVIADLNEDGAKAVASRFGENALGIKCDVTNLTDLQQTMAQSISEFGRVDIIVNNAGWTHKNQPMLEVSEEEFDRVFEINVKSIYQMSKASIPHLRENGGGVIINIGSTAGKRPRPGLSWYNATKGAVNLLSKSMAVELAPDNIRVNCIAPVIGATALLESFMGEKDTPEARAKFVGGIPLGRFSTPRDIANAALYFASDEASFITGVVMEVDGGRCI
ncbi:MAG: SDR family oxidoreductase [Hyphomicrobiales bacterium]|nr:SDR family oxidoreductase [Hyphomicrobiales bacterium]